MLFKERKPKPVPVVRDLVDADHWAEHHLSKTLPRLGPERTVEDYKQQMEEMTYINNFSGVAGQGRLCQKTCFVSVRTV